MDTNRTPPALTAALARLTMAIDALESQISVLPTALAAKTPLSSDGAELAQKHDRLRSEVALVINELEQMVADRG